MCFMWTEIWYSEALKWFMCKTEQSTALSHIIKRDMREGFLMALVVIDAGHGGANPGATYKGRQEKDDAIALALAVGRI